MRTLSLEVFSSLIDERRCALRGMLQSHRGTWSHGQPLRTDRGLRHHRRPPHGRARGQGRVDRLSVPPVVRLALGVRSAPRRRARRPLPDRASARRRGAEAALPARHQRPADAVPVRRRRGRGVRLHAGGGCRRRAQPRASREDGPRRSAVSSCAATHASTTRAPRTPWIAAATRKSCSSAAPARASWRCGCARRSRCRSRMEPRRRVHARRRRVGVVRPRGGDGGRALALRAARLRDRCVQGNGELLAPLDRPQHVQGPLARAW